MTSPTLRPEMPIGLRRTESGPVREPFRNQLVEQDHVEASSSDRLSSPLCDAANSHRPDRHGHGSAQGARRWVLLWSFVLVRVSSVRDVLGHLSNLLDTSALTRTMDGNRLASRIRNPATAGQTTSGRSCYTRLRRRLADHQTAYGSDRQSGGCPRVSGGSTGLQRGLVLFLRLHRRESDGNSNDRASVHDAKASR